MDTLLKADIFFFVTTIAIILLTIGGIIITVYVWRIARDMKEVSQRLKEQAYKVSDDIDEMRSELKQTGFKGLWASIVRIGSIFKKHKKKHHEKKHKEHTS